MSGVNKQTLIDFEAEVARRFEAGLIRGPIHLSGGNEDQLIELFRDIRPTDWVFSTWRNHYHALFHGIPPEKVMERIMQGESMNMTFPEHNFFTSAIVGGILPIAVGVAYSLRGSDKEKPNRPQVHVFIGDMAETTGICHECEQFSGGYGLPIRFIVEDNGLSCNSPTYDCWGDTYWPANWERYDYKRTGPHVGTGKWVTF